MKKLLALLLALIMTLSLSASLAEDVFAPEATKTVLSLELDRAFFAGLIAENMGEAAAANESLINAALDVAEKLSVNVVAAGQSGEVTLLVNEKELLTMNCVMQGENLVLVSNAFPSYALSVKLEDVLALLEQSMSFSVNGKKVSREEMMETVTQLMGVLPAYAEDLSAVVNDMMAKATTAEDGTVTLNLTKHQVAEAVERVAARLKDDEVLKPYLQMALDQQNAKNGENTTLEELFARVQATVEELKAGEDDVLATADVKQTQDGNIQVTADLSGRLLVDVRTSADTEGNIIDAMLLTSTRSAANDWDALYEGLQTGENTEDACVDIRVKTYNPTEEGVDRTFFYLEVMAQGMDVILSAMNTVRGAGTPDFYSYTNIGIDPGMTDNDVIALNIENSYTKAPAPVSLEGLTVIDVLHMSAEEQGGLMQDITGNGLAQLLGAAQEAIPEQMGVVMQMLQGGAMQ